jgi:hypothetical protein
MMRDQEMLLSMVPQTSSAARQSQRNYFQGIASVWRWLCQPWPLLFCGALALGIVLGGLVLPQLPGQLVNEPATAARWLATTSAAYGSAGAILRTLGMFDVLHSPALRLLMMAIGLIVSIQLAELLGGVMLVRALHSRVRNAAPTADTPLELPPYGRIFRMRCAHPSPPTTAVDRLVTELGARFPKVVRITIAQAEPRHVHAADQSDADEAQFRLLGLRSVWAVYVRPLLMLGLLVALASLWIMIVAGWQVTTPNLAPGDSYRSALHDVEVTYTQPATDSVAMPVDVAPVVELRIGEHTERREIAQATRFQMNQVNVRVAPQTPALLVSATGNGSTLARPGEVTSASSVGLVFPSPGSEQALLLPDVAAGLRIVRLAEPAQTYAVELYRGDALQPVERFQITGSAVETVTIGSDLQLSLMPVPGLQVEILYLPMAWLLWVALALVVAGVSGFWKQPAFLLVQAGPWPLGRTVLTAQSDRLAEIHSLQIWSEQATPTDPPEHDTAAA